MTQFHFSPPNKEDRAGQLTSFNKLNRESKFVYDSLILSSSPLFINNNALNQLGSW
jgi:hypothetical protein